MINFNSFLIKLGILISLKSQFLQFMKLEDLAIKKTRIVNGYRIKHYLGGDVESLTTVIQ